MRLVGMNKELNSGFRKAQRQATAQPSYPQMSSGGVIVWTKFRKNRKSHRYKFTELEKTIEVLENKDAHYSLYTSPQSLAV